jgi:uncharacterized surface protein with fasciclin (FAS1) repeats
MKNVFQLICFIAFTFVVFSCKNETKETPLKAGEIPAKKELTQIDKNQINSIMTKAMVTTELKTFVSMIVTTGLADKLAKEDGPFTIFAPSNDAFKNLDAKKMEALLNTANKEQLTALVKSHIFKGSLDSVNLVQKIKDGNGNYKIVTLSGATYTASKEDADIVITDKNGNKAIVGKSDISGSNGVLHVLDNVLSQS